MELKDIFRKALSPFMNKSDSKEAYDMLDQGQAISVAPKSDRYTYNNQEDTNYDKSWTPKTDTEKKTLSPEGYHRVGERDEKKAELQGDMNDKDFNEAYKEKQISVDSTAISNITYDPKDEGLKVKFKGSGKEYFYPGVPLETVQAFLKAPSKGEYFMNNIHDQYSMYGKDHSRKGKSQQKAVKKYMKSYYKQNKNMWKAAAKARAKGDKE
ncbi:MAG: KTSC domain-containing protein [Bacteroidales bacterium]|nr:KTSC domain-containing protein [Bacteroidales bacterium]